MERTELLTELAELVDGVEGFESPPDQDTDGNLTANVNREDPERARVIVAALRDGEGCDACGAVLEHPVYIEFGDRHANVCCWECVTAFSLTQLKKISLRADEISLDTQVKLFEMGERLQEAEKVIDLLRTGALP
jgi:hypothetical protein